MLKANTIGEIKSKIVKSEDRSTLPHCPINGEKIPLQNTRIVLKRCQCTSTFAL
jgi:hypothetical protein